MIHPVVVVVNSLKAIYTCLAPFKGNHDGAVVSGFFIAPMTSTVPLTIASTPDCGGEGGKRFSLTQGERLHEGCAPSDKRPSRLMNCGDYRIVGSINKAAQHNKGSNPIVDTQQGEGRDSLNLRLNHHPYRSPCIA